jgi:hypothetical protein
MSLVDLFSLELPLIAVLVENRVLELRLVSKTIMMALEANSSMHSNIRISVAGMENLTADFLLRWNGRLQLECRRPCAPDSGWFNTVRDALLFARLCPLSLLSLWINGNNL